MDTTRLQLLAASHRLRAQGSANEYTRAYEEEMAAYFEELVSWIEERRDWVPIAEAEGPGPLPKNA